MLPLRILHTLEDRCTAPVVDAHLTEGKGKRKGKSAFLAGATPFLIGGASASSNIAK